MYKWVCNSDDGYFEDSDIDHHCTFETQEECYYDMRDAVLAKMTWNTEWTDLLEDCGDYEDKDGIVTMKEKDDTGYWGIGYDVRFYTHKIVHTSYSGTYTYEIVKID